MRTSTRSTGSRARIAAAVASAIGVLAIASVAMASGGEAPHAPDVNWTDGMLNVGGTPGKNPPFVAVIINFFIFVGLLVWKAGPPLTSYLNRRHTDVKGALEEAARMQKEASDLLAERQAKLGAVDREVDDLVKGMQADADSEKQRMVDDAETAAVALKRDADERIAAGITRARDAIEAEVVAAAIDAAEKLIRSESSDDDHNALVESFIQSLTDGSFGDGGGSGGSGGGGSPPSRPKSDSAVDDGWS